MVKVVSTIRDLRLTLETWRRRDETVGFIPTMGALHAGHISLLRKAQSLASHTIMSIFVNPMQFGPSEDFDKYPRQSPQDEALLNANGCDLLFLPSVETMYPSGFSTKVEAGSLALELEGAARPDHFAGVATVVTKLLLLTMPDYAFFGEKDYQQYRVIEQITQDLHIPTSIIPVPIYRDEDGLAMSSRNVYLSSDERKRALALPQTLETAAEDIRAGHDIAATLTAGKEQLEQAGFVVDYFDLVDQRTLRPALNIQRPARLMAAATIGKTRLIDNMPL